MNENEKHPKIGIALGSGGARGMAHIGVLKALEKHNITVDYMAGSSIGSLVAGLYAVGLSPDNIQKCMSIFAHKMWRDYTVPKMGFVSGEKLKELIRLFTKNKNIEQANIPLSIVATNLQKGERKIFTKGSMTDAIRASISIPGILVPEEIDGVLYVDGGVIDRVPISVVKEMGADLAIAIDVSYFESTHPITSIFDVITQSIDVMEREILKYRMIHADFLLRPQVGHYSTMMFSKMDELIAEGERVTLEMIPEIKEMIKKWEENNQDGQGTY